MYLDRSVGAGFPLLRQRMAGQSIGVTDQIPSFPEGGAHRLGALETGRPGRGKFVGDRLQQSLQFTR